MRPPLDNGTVLLTGASSGIGRAMAYELAGRVRALVLVARRVERLEALAKDLRERHGQLQVEVARCDITRRDEADFMLEKATAAVGPIDILINNAGMGDICLFELSSWEKLEAMIQVNVIALTYLSRRVIESMKERGRGGILNISSGFGLTVLPGFAAYAGSKHYDSASSAALSIELRGTGIVVSQVCPGPVATEFEQVADNPTGHTLPDWAQLSAEVCARRSIRAFARGRTRIIPDRIMRVLAALYAYSPRALTHFVYRPASSYFRRHSESPKADRPQPPSLL